MTLESGEQGPLSWGFWGGGWSVSKKPNEIKAGSSHNRALSDAAGGAAVGGRRYLPADVVQTKKSVALIFAQFLRLKAKAGWCACVREDFPTPGEMISLSWQEAQQNFVITAVE